MTTSRIFHPRHFMTTTTLLLLAIVAATANAQTIANLQVGDEICAEGFVLDTYCIERTTLLDNPTVFSLENPELHSVHCLVDVNSCFSSPFEMLVNVGSQEYARGWRFDDAGRQAMVTLGRQVGSQTLGCTECEPDGGDPTDVAFTRQQEGLRAVVKAQVTSLKLEDDLKVPELTLLADPIHTNTTISTIPILDESVTDPCQRFYGMTNILDILTPEEQSQLFTTETPASFRNLRLIHGSCMLIGWGLLLPNGMLVARYFKLHPSSNSAWFKFHRICQPTGLLVATVGWIIALVNFDVFSDRDTRFVHGLVGSIVMALGWLQPLNAYFRPHISPDHPKTTTRIVWEHYHRGAGWFCFFCSLIVIVLGTLIIPRPNDRLGFQSAFVVCLLIMLGNLAFMKSDSKQDLRGFCCTRKIPPAEEPKEKDEDNA
ncbi:unnamed protein product [Cylindrotheca closterium]|uniref:Cytochrome b561 domain-containing protein n=1 Tax=Cylindrotheca closterium TaxID=2856 RepID=A0AAD2CI12_9STRA|nr:unnamed protein product [Cylindrotheca closterium]